MQDVYWDYALKASIPGSFSLERYASIAPPPVEAKDLLLRREARNLSKNYKSSSKSEGYFKSLLLYAAPFE